MASSRRHTSRERHGKRTLSDFLLADAAFGAMLDEALLETGPSESPRHKSPEPSRHNSESSKQPPGESSRDSSHPLSTKPGELEPTSLKPFVNSKPNKVEDPLEETPFDKIAPGIDPLSQLAIYANRKPSSPTKKPSLAGYLMSGLDVLLKTVSKQTNPPQTLSPGKKRKSPSPETRGRGSSSAAAPSKQKTPTPPLDKMFDNDTPTPPEHLLANEPPAIPTELPSFKVVFTKPVPEPRFELVRSLPSSAISTPIKQHAHARSSSTSASFVRWARGVGGADDVEGGAESGQDDEMEEEFVNGKSVASHFEFKENQYVRYIEPTEEELSARIEYDMDEQDKAWLASQNAHRHATTSDTPIPDILFEFIMDRLEKEWFDLFKQIPKPRKDVEEPEDNNCAICDDGECENSNAIVFCDGCNLAVHQDCYGVPFIPEGQWLCRRCMVSPDRPVSCCLCPNENGALKQTNSNKWAHVVCAQWIPEASFANATYMEPIDSKSVPASRYKLTCYLCGKRKGACIQCVNKHCYASYHATCARKCKLFMKVGEDMKSCCDKHSPKEYRDQVDVEKEIFLFRRAHNFTSVKFKSTPELEADLLLNLNQPSSSSTAPHDDPHHHHTPAPHSPPPKRAKHNTPSTRRTVIDSEDEEEDPPSTLLSRKEQTALDKHHDLLRRRDEEYKKLIAHPVVPLRLWKAVTNAIKGSSNVRGKNAFVEKCCRYWALKREGRRGAPLLKRLHLEPWTATSSVIQQDETVRAKRIQVLKQIRNDLERVRMLCELVKKREQARLKRSLAQRHVVDLVLHPVSFILHPVLEQVRRLDQKRLFEEDVDVEAVPDYLSVVGRGMSFEEMERRLEGDEYRSVKEFQDDFLLICRNAQLYNKPDTPWFRAADRLLVRSVPILESAFEQERLVQIDRTTGCLADGVPTGLFELYDGVLPDVLDRFPGSATVGVVDAAKAAATVVDVGGVVVEGKGKEREVEGMVVDEEKEEEEQEVEEQEEAGGSGSGEANGEMDKQAQLLEDERLAKALHEEELLSSPA
ncbi:nuA3 HAT complex component nto1, partial [Podochytrium sp. JEL0797]